MDFRDIELIVWDKVSKQRGYVLEIKNNFFHPVTVKFHSHSAVYNSWDKDLEILDPGKVSIPLKIKLFVIEEFYKRLYVQLRKKKGTYCRSSWSSLERCLRYRRVKKYISTR